MTQTSHSDWYCAPRALCKPHVTWDNVALIPASELRSLAKWQQRAQQLPSGNTLLVVPCNNPRLLEGGRRIDQSLGTQGRPLILVSTRSR